MARYFITLPDKDLAYLPEGTDDFRDYMEAVGWAQDFAMLNRQIMLNRTVDAIRQALGRDDLATIDTAVYRCDTRRRRHSKGSGGRYMGSFRPQ